MNFNKNNLLFKLCFFALFAITYTSCSDDDVVECTATTWYEDNDSDGLGNAAVSIEACEQPEGYVADNTDIDDTVAFCEVLTWYEDADSDGLGNTDVSLNACDQPEGYVIDNTDTNDNLYKYYLGLSLPAVELYPQHILQNITSGTASIANAQEIPGIASSIPVIGKDGYLFLNSTEKITKYEVGDDGILVDLGSTVNTGISGGPIATFLSDDRLLVSTGARAAEGGTFSYQIINTETMTEESTGAITLPIYESDSKAAPSLFIPKDGKIYVPYYQASSTWAAYDFASVAIYDASTLAFEKNITTDKAAGLGFSVISSHFLLNNDLYLISSNTGFWTGNETIPSGLVRINSGEDDFDEDYFLNLTDKVNGNHTGGMAYAENNKVVFQVFRGDLITAYADYSESYTIEYYVVDLITESVTQLDIPLCKYPRDMIEYIGDEKVAITANTAEGNFVYIYNSSTNTVSKGLEYTGADTISSFISFK